MIASQWTAGRLLWFGSEVEFFSWGFGMALGEGINAAAQRVFQSMIAESESLQIAPHTLANGASLLDCGVKENGGIAAGLQFASICLAGKADVSVTNGPAEVWPGPWIQVTTDHPVEACMLGQYAGWPVKHDDFFAMGSGPMRVQRGKEELLVSLAASDSSAVAVGTLECDTLPNTDVVEAMANECGVATDSIFLAVAPTRSVAGCIQVVARSVETSLHKLHELGFELTNVRNAYGRAPVPTPTPNFAKGIGRTNDAILYGGHVCLWVVGDDDQIAELGAKLPSCASRDFGEPFAKIFKRYEYDFYKVDPSLFSPAEVTIMNLSTGSSWRFGSMRGDLILESFGTTVSSS